MDEDLFLHSESKESRIAIRLKNISKNLNAIQFIKVILSAAWPNGCDIFLTVTRFNSHTLQSPKTTLYDACLCFVELKQAEN